MGAEEARAYPHRPLDPDSARNAQHCEFGVDVEAVARLDLDGGDALGNQRVDPGEGAGEEGVGIRPSRRFDGGEDSAAGPRDLFVARPLEPHLELPCAVAAVDEMRVAVDERRGDEMAFEIAPAPCREVVGNRVGRTAPGDAPGVQSNRAVVDEAVGSVATLHGGQRQVEEEFPGHSSTSLNGGSMRDSKAAVARSDITGLARRCGNREHSGPSRR